MGGSFGNTRGKRANVKIHKGQQDKHIPGTNNYKQRIRNGDIPSIITENPDKLLKEGAGKGKNYTNREVVDYGRIIGKYYDIGTKRYYDTTRATIHYNQNGEAHIVPAMPNWMIKRK